MELYDSYSFIGFRSTLYIKNNYLYDWTGIIGISMDGREIVGLKANGSVISYGTIGFKEDYYSVYVPNLTEIVAVSVGNYHVLGLKSNGTVVAAYDYIYGNDDGECNIGGWKDIKLP